MLLKPTYVASQEVIDIMNVDKNIVETAHQTILERYARLGGLRQTIVNAKNGYSEDALTNIQQKVEVEIEERQSARQQYIDGMAVPAQ